VWKKYLLLAAFEEVKIWLDHYLLLYFALHLAKFILFLKNMHHRYHFKKRVFISALKLFLALFILLALLLLQKLKSKIKP